MEYTIVLDSFIVAVNRGTRENETRNIIYRDSDGELQTIDFETCARNYKEEHSNASQYCIGERTIDESCFVFYTSGIKTKIIFDKMYISNLLHHHFLSGYKSHHFHQLQHYINQTKYTTFDLS